MIAFLAMIAFMETAKNTTGRNATDVLMSVWIMGVFYQYFYIYHKQVHIFECTEVQPHSDFNNPNFIGLCMTKIHRLVFAGGTFAM